MNIAEFVGSSSGPYENWGNNVRTHKQVSNAATLSANLLYPNQLGFVSGRDADRVAQHIANVDADNGKQYRADVNTSIKELLLLWDNAFGSLTVMTGNEITSRDFNKNTGSNPIATYVEYDFAPFVQAVNNRIPITLGSIGNGSSVQNRAFLAALLDYTIVGTYACKLAGKRVRDLITSINVHYIVGKGRQLDYIVYLDSVTSYGLPLIVGEELGRKVTEGDFGGGTAIRVLGRLLHYASLRNLTSNQFRVLYWATAKYGQDPNSTADKALTHLVNFIGKETELTKVNVQDEGYVFQAGNKRFAILVGDATYQPKRKWKTVGIVTYVAPVASKESVTLVFFKK